MKYTVQFRLAGEWNTEFEAIGRDALLSCRNYVMGSISACESGTDVHTDVNRYRLIDPDGNYLSADKWHILFAAMEFPNTFGLLEFPDDTFRVSVQSSYISGDTVMLYTERLVNGKWLSFAKGTANELHREMTYIGLGIAATRH